MAVSIDLFTLLMDAWAARAFTLVLITDMVYLLEDEKID